MTMKTVEHDGKVYQIDTIYEFSDGSDDWYIDILRSISNGSNPFVGARYAYKQIREYDAVPIGTITDSQLDGDT